MIASRRARPLVALVSAVAMVAAAGIPVVSGASPSASGSTGLTTASVAGQTTKSSTRKAKPTAKPSPAPKPSPTPTPSPAPTPWSTSSASPTAPLAYSTSLRRYPYLTDVVGTNATINWATDTSQTTGYVTYGVSGVDSCTANSAAATSVSVVIGNQTERLWKATFSVSPQTAYCYRVFLGNAPSGVDLLGGDPSPVFRSQLAPGSTAPFSFAVFGDWGQVSATGTNPDQANLMAQLAASPARFAISTGDNGYPSGSQANFGDLVQTGQDISTVFGPQFWSLPGRSIPFFPAIGNHGFARSDTNHPHLINYPQTVAVATSGGRYVRETYCCVDGTSSANNPSAWYAFDVGSSRFYILEAAWSDSNVGTATKYQVDHDYHWTPSSTEYQWLAADLAAHPSAIKFAIFHFPLYSDNATETSDTFLQGASSLEGLLGSNGVAMAFNGHAHIYQRNAAAPGGVVSYVTGGGGATLEPVTKCSSLDQYGIGWSYSSAKGSACGHAVAPSSPSQVFHFLLVSVNGNRVTVTPTTETGATFDSQTYTVGSSGDTNPPSTPAGVTATSAGDTSIGVSWQASTDNVGVAGYTIYRDGTAAGTVGAAFTTFTDTGLAPATGHSYTVDAFDAAGNHSPQSSPPATASTDPDTTAPTIPANVAASATGSTAISVTWSASSDDVAVSGYDVTRDGTIVATLGAAATSFMDSGLQPSTTYSYTVDAFDGAGNHSAQSSAAGATTSSSSTTIFSDGFESGTLNNWTTKSGLVVESTTVNSGSFAAEGNTTNGATYAKKLLPSTYSVVHASVWYQIVSAAAQVNLLRLRTAADVSIGYLYVNTSGNLGLRDDAGATTLTSQVLPGPGWHLLDWTLSVNGASSSTVVRLDGVLVPSLSDTRDWGTTQVGKLQIGEVATGRTYDVVFDDTEIDVPGS